MPYRLRVLATLAGLLLFIPSASAADGWTSKYPELVFAVVPAENASGTAERFAPLADYLARQIGVPVKLRIVSDYAGVIEGQRTGQVHIGYYGPASFAQASADGVKIEPFAVEVNADGSKAYYSVLYVKADSPYQRVEDLRGKNLGLVDTISTSGNKIPRLAFYKMGIDPETFFGKIIYTGSHENAIIALQGDQVNVAANAWNSDDESFLRRLEAKGLAKYSDFRIILKSDPILNSPVAYIDSLPDELKAKIRDAFYNIEANDPALWAKFSGGKYKPWVPVDRAAYEPYVELNAFIEKLRRKKN